MGIGCAVIFLCALIGGIVIVRTIKHQVVLANEAGKNGVALQRVIQDYHTRHGTYPNSLIDMVQEGSLDGKELHNDLDDSPDPGHLSWRYTKPDEGAPDSTPILEEPYHITIGGKTKSARIVIQLDGRVAVNTPAR